MALLSYEDRSIKTFDENKSKSCIILEIGRYLCTIESGNLFTMFTVCDLSSTRQSLINLLVLYVLVLKIRAYQYHLLLTTFSYLQIARNQKDLMKDVCILA